MFNKLLSTGLLLAILAGSSVIVVAQTPIADASIKAKVEKRAASKSRTKVKLHSGTTYIGVLNDVTDTSFTVTSKAGDRQVVRYADVKSVGGLGWGSATKIGLGIAIGAGAVLAVLAAVIASDN
jgi:hypothetical protein